MVRNWDTGSSTDLRDRMIQTGYPIVLIQLNSFINIVLSTVIVTYNSSIDYYFNYFPTGNFSQ